MLMFSELKEDAEAYAIMKSEIERQKSSIGLIASENIASPAVLKAMGSVFSNKYAEGYPSKRYYAGNEFIDNAENLAINRAKKLFSAEHVNVQPHAGAIANLSAYLALLNPGDKIMGLALDQGGHLTHGHSVNFSSKFYKASFYYLDRETQALDYDAIRKRALEEKPNLIIAGYSAYSRAIDFKAFADIAQECNAFLMADIAHIAGLVAGNMHSSPVGYADAITTTTHKTLRGPRGAMILCKEKHAKAVDKAVFPATQGGPLENMIFAKAVAFQEALQPDFKDYAKQVVKNSKAMCAEMQNLGYDIVSGGTDNHLFLIDLRKKGISGKEAQLLLEQSNIIINMNSIPYDTASPMNPSGIRIGTPSITTRGMKETECIEIARLIDLVLSKKLSAETAKSKAKELCSAFPIYANLEL